MSKQALVRGNVFIQRCLSLGLGNELQSFLEILASQPEISKELLDIVSELNKPSKLSARIQDGKRELGQIDISDVDGILANLGAFKKRVSEIVKMEGLSATARRLNMNPANLAAWIKSDRPSRYDTVRRIAAALAISYIVVDIGQSKGARNNKMAKKRNSRNRT
jgi:hypothetical protein